MQISLHTFWKPAGGRDNKCSALQFWKVMGEASNGEQPVIRGELRQTGRKLSVLCIDWDAGPPSNPAPNNQGMESEDATIFDPSLLQLASEILDCACI